MTGIAPVAPASTAEAGPAASSTDAAASRERFAAALTAAVGPAASPRTSGGVHRFVTLGEMTSGQPAPAAAMAAAAGTLDGALGGPQPVSGAGQGDPDAGGRVIEAARRYLGVPYKWGGTNPATGLDCSGFVQRVYADLGVSLPRVSVDQAKQGTAVAGLEQAQPGDLVFWRGSPNHIGIYAGDGQMIVAPRTGDVVKFQKITRTPHEIRRVI